MRLTSRLLRLPAALRTEDRGAALFEMAVVVPVLLLMAIGVAEFGRIYFNGITVANAALAGAEYGAQGLGSGDDALIRQVARNDANDQALSVTSARTCRCPGSDVVVACSTVCAGGYGNPQFFIAVTVTKTHTLLFHYPGLPSTITVTRTATFREQ